MIGFIRVLLFIINIISYVVTALFAILAIYDQINGQDGVEKLLKKLKIPLSYNQVLIIGIVSIMLIGFTHILLDRLQ